MGTQCFIQNYVDHDPAKGDDAYRDYTCGPLSYDGHKGTDFRARNEADMKAGIAVLAAADGTVLALRDGVVDMNIRDRPDSTAVAGKECGNGVLLDHGDGWQTQYCHLRRGSIAVKPRDPVKAGDKLGLIGLSGNTEFPHLHFELRHKGATIDPFVGQAGAYDCQKLANRQPLWSEAAREAVAYRPTGVLGTGFATRPITKEEARTGGFSPASLPATAPALVFWVEFFGARKDDVIHLTLFAPDGAGLAEHQTAFEQNKAVAFYLVGRKSRDKWPEGTYRGRVALKRPTDRGARETVIEQEWLVPVGGN